MQNIFGSNMTYISIRLFFILPLLLHSEDFDFPSSLYPISSNRVVEINITLDQINREILYHLSTDTNSTDYEYEDIVKLRDRLNNYLDYSNSYNHHRYIDNSSILVSRNSTTNTSTIKNNIKRVNSTIKNSNIGVIIDEDIKNSVIENEVSVVNSHINNSNMGIEIRGNRVKNNQILKNHTSSKNVIIKSLVNHNNDISVNSSNGISIGN